MEFSKETEKFAFGFATDKLVGNTSVKELHDSNKPEKSTKQEIAEIALTAAAVAGITLFKLKADKKKKSKKKKRRKGFTFLFFCDIIEVVGFIPVSEIPVSQFNTNP